MRKWRIRLVHALPVKPHGWQIMGLGLHLQAFWCFPPHLAGAQKNRSWNKVVTWMAAMIRLICLSKSFLPIFSLLSSYNIPQDHQAWVCLWLQRWGMSQEKRGGWEQGNWACFPRLCKEHCTPPFQAFKMLLPPLRSLSLPGPVRASLFSNASRMSKWDRSDMGSADV